jgi:CheY-like chemotaxis protein
VRSIKILLADDHRIMRDGLRSLIAKQAGMEVVAEADNGRAAVKLTRRLKPDVVVMDINMPDLNGIEATRQIVGELPNTKIVAFSMHTDHQFVAGALKAGVSGYLQKDSAFEELALAIRTVVDNRIFLSPKITGDVVKGYVGKLPCRTVGPGTRSDPAVRRRSHHQTYRRAPQSQHQDRRDPPAQHHGKTRHLQHRRAYQICNPQRTDHPRYLNACAHIFLLQEPNPDLVLVNPLPMMRSFPPGIPGCIFSFP